MVSILCNTGASLEEAFIDLKTLVSAYGVVAGAETPAWLYPLEKSVDCLEARLLAHLEQLSALERSSPSGV